MLERPVDDAANAAATEDVALHAHDGEVGRRRERSGLVPRADVQHAEAVSAHPAGDPSAGLESAPDASHVEADAPAVEQNRRVAAAARGHAAEAEQAPVLEEELALLRKEQAEARQVDLLLVGFDLREVGVVGEVGRQVLRHAVLRRRRRSRPTHRWRRPESRAASLVRPETAYGLISRFAGSRRRFEPDDRRRERRLEERRAVRARAAAS